MRYGLMSRTKLLYLVWTIACVALVLMLSTYKRESVDFYGIAETREIVVNSESAVVIKKIHAVPGQKVVQGELIVELDNPELARTINEISHELEETRAEYTTQMHEFRTQLNELRAEKTSLISDIDYQIRQLQAAYDMNRQLSSGLKSMERDTEQDVPKDLAGPIEIQIESLKEARKLTADPLRVRIHMLEKELQSTENPLQIHAARLDKELNLLLEEKNKLYIFAQVTGIIGSVNCKAGETISPYDPILTLHTKSPSYIKGFIHEYVYSRISLGQQVRVVSMADPAKTVIGTVVGVGSRIIQYPQRLQRMLNNNQYGREVRIKIPENNRLLLGEKVLVTLYGSADQSAVGSGDNFSLAEIHAKKISEHKHPVEAIPEIFDITVAGSLKDIGPIEASGVIYLKDLKHYIIISDDTIKKQPVVYLMDTGGAVQDELLIQGLDKINDMEAIAEDHAGNIYIACSLSSNKKGRLPDARKLLVRAVRDRALLRLDRKVFLYDVIRQAALKYADTDWAQLVITDGNVAVNIEGIFCRDGALYLGLRTPLKDNKAAIIKISEIDRVFEKSLPGKQDVELWQTFDLKDRVSGVCAGISDLHLSGNTLYIVSYNPDTVSGTLRDAGNLWKYDFAGNDLQHVRRFADAKPEGVTINSDTKEIVITCDRDAAQPSQMITLRLD